MTQCLAPYPNRNFNSRRGVSIILKGDTKNNILILFDHSQDDLPCRFPFLNRMLVLSGSLGNFHGDIPIDLIHSNDLIFIQIRITPKSF